MTVNILGTKYTITKKKYSEEPAFERRSIDGYCDHYTKNIVYCDMSTYPHWEHEPPETVVKAERQTLRHEIVHGFLSESGLKFCSDMPDGGWAVHVVMVDWLANQGPKLYEAWQEAGAL